jgi:two-component system, sensor histidine kinase YesM
MDQLEKNIYILTDLIQEYMYTYLYYEAVHLALQSTMITSMIVLMGVLVLSLVLLYFLLTNSRKLSRRIVDPIDSICERLEAIGKGSLLVCEPIQADVKEVQLLSDGIESMVGRLKQLIDKNTEQEKQRRRTELALLQAQINPHFLYNTLDTIIWLIESKEISEAVTMVGSLSNYFRFSLSRGQNVITLAEEEQHITKLSGNPADALSGSDGIRNRHSGQSEKLYTAKAHSAAAGGKRAVSRHKNKTPQGLYPRNRQNA